MARHEHLSLTDKAVNALPQAVYERRYPNHKDDEPSAWEQSLGIMRWVANGERLPPHQYTRTYQRILDVLENPSNAVTLRRDSIWFDKHKFAHCFVWTIGRPIPTKRGQLDEAALFQIVKEKGEFWTIRLTTVLLPESHLVAASSFSALFLSGQGEGAARGATMAVSNQASEEMDFGAMTFMTPVIDVDRVQRLQIEDNGSKLALLSNEGWRVFYHLIDNGGYRYFFSRERENSGKKSPPMDDRMPFPFGQRVPQPGNL